MKIAKLGSLLKLMKAVDALKGNILPEDYIQTEANEIEADVIEELEEVDVLVEKLRLAVDSKNIDEMELVLARVVYITSSLEGSFGNIADDTRDLLSGKYRFA